MLWKRLLIVGLILGGGAVGLPARAFTPEVRLTIVRRAIKLMPPSLAHQLQRHRLDLEQAALSGIDRQPNAPMQLLDPNQAGRQIEALVQEGARLVARQAPMAELARVLGAIAQATTDLAFAFNLGPDDPRRAAAYPEFCRYVEAKLPRLAFTFSGWPDDALAQADFVGFAQATAAQASRDLDGLMRSYYPEGRRPTAQDFDERSIPFAAAALESSLAMTATAKAWLAVWFRAGGDLTGTPFLNPDAAASPSPPAPLNAAGLDLENKELNR